MYVYYRVQEQRKEVGRRWSYICICIGTKEMRSDAKLLREQSQAKCKMETLTNSKATLYMRDRK